MKTSAVTTHDLPTIAGLWTGSDLAAQRELGLNPNEEGTQEIRKRLATMAGLSETSSIDEAVERTHKLLAHAPSAVIAATVEDALGLEERPNMPGTTGERGLTGRWHCRNPRKIWKPIRWRSPLRGRSETGADRYSVARFAIWPPRVDIVRVNC